MTFRAEKVHVKADVEIQAPFIVLLTFSQLGSEVSHADLCRAKESASWDPEGMQPASPGRKGKVRTLHGFRTAPWR